MTLKKCPFCAEEIQVDAKKCRFCGEFLDAKASQGLSGFDLTLLLCLCGACLLTLGVFLPAVSLPIVGSINLFRNGQGDGVFLLLFAVAAVVFGIWRRPVAILVSGLLALSFLCFEATRIAHFISAMKAKSDAELAGNPFRGLADIAFNSVELQWGWFVLFLGALMLIFAGTRAYILRLAPEASRSAMVKVGLVTIVVSIASAGVGYGFESPFPSTQEPAAVKATPAPPSIKDSSIGEGWHLREETNEMDGSKSATLLLEADSEIEGLIGKVKPHLVLRCKDHSTGAYVAVQTQVQNEYGSFNRATVRLRFDERDLVRQSWLESTDGKGLFAPQPVPFIKQLLASEVFRFEFTPFQKSATTVRFKVKGLAEMVDKVSKPCGWDDASVAARKAVADQRTLEHKAAWPLHVEVLAEGDSFYLRYEIDGDDSASSEFLSDGERKHLDGRTQILLRVEGTEVEKVGVMLNGKRLGPHWKREGLSYRTLYTIITLNEVENAK